MRTRETRIKPQPWARPRKSGRRLSAQNLTRADKAHICNQKDGETLRT